MKSYSFISTIVCIALAIFLFRGCKENQENNDLFNASQDTLRQYRNKNNEQVTKITIMQGQVKDLRRLNSSKDSSLKKLQALVDRKTNSATIIGTVTHNTGSSGTVITFNSPGSNTPNDISLSGKTDKICPCDSLIHDTIYPIYSTNWNERWSKGKIIANRDSIIRDVITFNEFSITEKWERQKWYKEKQPVMTITNSNPQTETVELKTFRVTPKKGKKLTWFGIGAVVSIVGERIILNLTR